MLHRLSRRETLYIVPLRALASEKQADFEEFERYGLDIGVSTGNYESEGGWPRKDIVVATSENVDSLVRNDAPWIEDLTCVVTDEVHLVDDGERGPTLEVTLAKLRRLNPDLQTVALSATIGNAEALATWLDAGLVDSDWRPIDLQKGVHYGQALHLEDGSQQRLSVQNNEKQTAAIVRDTLEDDGSTLALVNSRRNADRRHRAGHEHGRPHLSTEERDKLADIAEEIRDVTDTETSDDLADAVADGAAFHHAGLSRGPPRTRRGRLPRPAGEGRLCDADARGRREHALSSRRRPRLAALRRLERVGWPRCPCSKSIRCAAGRGARVSTPTAKRSSSRTATTKRTNCSSATSGPTRAGPVETRGRTGTADAHPRDGRLWLRTLPQGTARVPRTDAVRQPDRRHGQLERVVDDVLTYLQRNDFLEIEAGELDATSLGHTVSRLYLDPMSAAEIVDGLRDWERGASDSTSASGSPADAQAEPPANSGFTTASELAEDADESDADRDPDDISALGLYHLVSRTPDMYQLYLRSGDREEYEMELFEREEELLGPTPSEFEEGRFEDWLSALKTARLLEDWPRRSTRRPSRTGTASARATSAGRSKLPSGCWGPPNRWPARSIWTPHAPSARPASASNTACARSWSTGRRPRRRPQARPPASRPVSPTAHSSGTRTKPSCWRRFEAAGRRPRTSSETPATVTRRWKASSPRPTCLSTSTTVQTGTQAPSRPTTSRPVWVISDAGRRRHC